MSIHTQGDGGALSLYLLLLYFSDSLIHKKNVYNLFEEITSVLVQG